MRRIIILVLALAVGQCSTAEELRITTWNLKWFPSGVPNRRDPANEATRIIAAADVLRKLDPDILLLQEVRDEESAIRLCEAIAPQRYQIAIVSRFQDDSAIGWQQLVIAAKSSSKAAYARAWKTVGPVDPPRGFAFAIFRFGRLTLAAYSLHLKSNLTRGDVFRAMQLNILKRELAAQQVIDHLATIPTELGSLPDIVVIGGDLNTSTDDPRFASEKTLLTFERAGFMNPILCLQKDQRFTILAEGKYPSATFDYILARGGASLATSILETKVSDHRPVTLTIELP